MDSAFLEPLLALAAGIVILITPRILRYAVAAYLVVIGAAGIARYLGVA